MAQQMFLISLTGHRFLNESFVSFIWTEKDGKKDVQVVSEVVHKNTLLKNRNRRKVQGTSVI